MTKKPLAMLPPTVGEGDDPWPFGGYDAITAAARDDHPLLGLMRLRQEAANQIERLLAFLDTTEGDPDAEGYVDCGNSFYATTPKRKTSTPRTAATTSRRLGQLRTIQTAMPIVVGQEARSDGL